MELIGGTEIRARTTHPILFQPDMVQAILERRKMQTRRIPNAQNARWQVGDHLWVRERALYWTDGAAGTSDVVYAEAPEIPQLLLDNNRLLVERETRNAIATSTIGKWRWRNAIFMPRWASRLTLEVVQVRLQHLQEITPEDAEAEGIPNPCGYYCDVHIGHVDHHGTIRAYERLWDSINAKRGYPWESNPLVRAFTFEVVSHAQS